MNELIETLKEAQNEIRALRHQNEVLAAKVEVMDNFMCVLHTAPAVKTQGVGIDVTYELQKHIYKLEQAEIPKAV